MRGFFPGLKYQSVDLASCRSLLLKGGEGWRDVRVPKASRPPGKILVLH